MGGSSKPAGETTTTQEPWGGVAPYLKDLYARVGGSGGTGGGVAGGVFSGGGGAQPGGGWNQVTNIGGIEVDPFWRGPSGQIAAAPPTAGGGAATSGGAVGGRGGGGVAGLIDQPMLIADPVGFRPAELIAQRRMLDIARQGVPDAASAAASEIERTLGGGYLGADANPYLEGMYQAASRPVIEDFTEQVLPALTGQFAAAGRGGSGMQAAVQQGATEDLTRNLADRAAQLYGGAYESERDRMLRAGALAPQVGTLERDISLQNAQLMGGVGSAQRELMEARNRAAEQRSREPWERYGLAAQLYGSGSPFTTASQPYYQNKMAGGLGGALTGAGTGFMLGGPMGAGIGGLGGLVLGGLL